MIKNKAMKLQKKQNEITAMRGFSLLEMIIAIFVFTLIIMTSVAVFANVVKTRKATRTIQTDMESTRTALDLMSKNIREATYFNLIAIDEISMYNEGQDICVYYNFDPNQLEVGYAIAVNLDTDMDGNIDVKCPNSPNVTDSYYPIIESGVSNVRFELDPTNINPGSEHIGKVTVKLEIGGKTMQTTASFRDYTGIIE